MKTRKRERFRLLLDAGTSEETTRFGHFTNPVTGEQIPYVDKLARIFKAGKPRQKEYTQEDIDGIIDRFKMPASELDWSVPLYKDHPADGDPKMDATVGNVRSLFRRGKGMASQLWGWLRFIGKDSVDKVVSGVYRKLSAGILLNPTELEHVGVLPDPHFDDTQIFSKSPKEATMAVTNTKETDEAKGQVAGGTQEPPAKEEAKAENLGRKKRPREASDLADVNDKWEGRFSKLAEENKVLKTQLAEQSKDFEEFRKERLANKASTRVEVFRAEGKTTKAMAEPEKAFVATLNDDQFEAYKAVKAKQPEFHSFEVFGDVGDTPGDDMPRKPGETEKSPEKVKENVTKLKDKYNKKGKKADA